MSDDTPATPSPIQFDLNLFCRCGNRQTFQIAGDNWVDQVTAIVNLGWRGGTQCPHPHHDWITGATKWIVEIDATGTPVPGAVAHRLMPNGDLTRCGLSEPPYIMSLSKPYMIHQGTGTDYIFALCQQCEQLASSSL